MMRRPESMITVLVGLAVFLAGCSATPTSLQAPDALVDDDQGAIQGTLADDSLLPVEGATIVLDGGTETRSDAAGRFEFRLVPPGPHGLLVFREGFREVSAQVDVVAGDVAVVRLTMYSIASQVPYFETSIVSGEISCSVAFRSSQFQNGASNRANACGVFTITGTAPDLDQEWRDHPVGARNDGKVGFWGETEWIPNQVLGKEMTINWGVQDHGDLGSSGWPVIQSSGPSPIRVRIPIDIIQPYWEGTAEDSDTGQCPAEGPCELYSLHFGRPSMTGTDLVDVAPYVQQRYTDYLTTFHFGTLPDDFSALPDR